MNISSSHVQNTFFLWTLWCGNWTGGVKFPSTAGGSVNSHTTSPHPHSCLKCPCVDGMMLYVIDWTTLGRGKFDAPCPVAVSQCPEKEGILDMARGNVHFQQHAWGYFAFKRLLPCNDDRSLPLVEKICDSMGFRAANRLRVDKVRQPAVFWYCLYFVLWREWQGSNNNSQKNRLYRWIHTKNTGIHQR